MSQWTKKYLVDVQFELTCSQDVQTVDFCQDNATYWCIQCLWRWDGGQRKYIGHGIKNRHRFCQKRNLLIDSAASSGFLWASLLLCCLGLVNMICRSQWLDQFTVTEKRSKLWKSGIYLFIFLPSNIQIS